MNYIPLQNRAKNAVPRGAAPATGIFAERTENAEIWDAEGRRYIDFTGGTAALNTGHCHSLVAKNVLQQMQQFIHTTPRAVPYQPYIKLAERLNKLAPGSTRKKTLFSTTGTEAIETSVKIARAYTDRAAIITFSGSFHERTLLAMGLTAQTAPCKVCFGTFASDIFCVPFPMANHGIDDEDSLTALKSLFLSEVHPDQVAAIIIEPVQGAGGCYIASPQFLQSLRAICDEHGILLIIDELHSGFASTGKTFAIEYAGIEPDMIIVGKNHGDGFPLSGVIGKAHIMDTPPPGSLGDGYRGNAVSCAAALGVLDVIDTEDHKSKARVLGSTIVQRLHQMAACTGVPCFGEIRNLGAMIAFELMAGPNGHEPDADMAKMLCKRAHDNGLTLLSCGIYGNTIRILVPLTTSDELVAEGLDLLEKSLVQCATTKVAA